MEGVRLASRPGANGEAVRTRWAGTGRQWHGGLVLALAASVLTGGCASRERPTVSTEARDRAADFRPSVKPEKYSVATSEALAQFEGPLDELYRLGPGDKIRVDVWGRPELSGERTVGPDGRITMPVVGGIKVVDLSADEAGAAITEAVSRAYADASATVAITDYSANRVLVLGRVAKPGALHFDQRPTLLDAIALAGSLPIGGIGADKAALTRCAVFRGRDRLIWIDLKALLTGANLAFNVRLQRDDVVYLPDADDQLVYVMGEVHKPGAYTLTPDMSFLDALAQAGGPTPDAAPSRIKLVRPAMEIERDIDFGDFLDARPDLNYALEEGDIVYVPRNTAATVGYYLQKISPLTGMAVFGMAVTQ
jgi:polysaccharide export outer membrane protein